MATAADPRVHLRPDRDHRPVLVQRRPGRDAGRSAVSRSTGTSGRSTTRASGRRSTTSLQAAIGATTCRAHPGVAASRSRSSAISFFGRDAVSFVVILPLALPGHRDRHRPQHGVPGDRARLRPADDHHRPRHVLRRRHLQQRRSPACGGPPRSIEEASMDLGADTFATFRRVTLPAIRTALIAGALLAFALSFDEIIVTNFTSGAGTQTLPIWIFTQLPAPEPAAARQRRGRLRPAPVDPAGLPLGATDEGSGGDRTDLTGRAGIRTSRSTACRPPPRGRSRPGLRS